MITKHIEQVRQAKKIKQTELAKALGISAVTYARKIKSFNGLTDLECMRAAKYLNLHIYVFTESLNPYKVEIL